MPLTRKGSEILANMEKKHGARAGTSEFYASINSGRIKGVEGKRKPRASAKSKR